jgi:hypothetical protein
MALPVANTFSRFESEAAIKSGKYANVRIKQMSTNMNPAIPWTNLSSAVNTIIAAGGWGGANTSELFHFSSTCWYFGQSLADELGTYGAQTLLSFTCGFALSTTHIVRIALCCVSYTSNVSNNGSTFLLFSFFFLDGGVFSVPSPAIQPNKM